MKTYGTAELDREAHKWRITAEPHVVVRLKRLFGRMDTKEHGTVSLGDTPETCAELLWFFLRYPMIMGEADSAHLQGRSDGYREHMDSLAQVLAGQYELRSFALADGMALREYQKQYVEVALRTGATLDPIVEPAPYLS